MAGLSFFTGPNRSKKHQAAILFAEGLHSERQIARELNVARSTLQEWKDHPDFIEVQAEYEREVRTEALHLAIANKTERIRVLDMLHRKTIEAIEARASAFQSDDDPISHAARVFGDAPPPEAATGLFAAKRSISATGKPVTDWVFDASLVKEIRELEKQAAQELGQWSEKSEVTTDGGMRIEIVGIADEDMP